MEKKMKKETYTYKEICRNCRAFIELEIPIGTSVNNYVRKYEGKILCSNCGCKVKIGR